jgi:hypothetical protein
MKISQAAFFIKRRRSGDGHMTTTRDYVDKSTIQDELLIDASEEFDGKTLDAI